MSGAPRADQRSGRGCLRPWAADLAAETEEHAYEKQKVVCIVECAASAPCSVDSSLESVASTVTAA